MKNCRESGYRKHERHRLKCKQELTSGGSKHSPSDADGVLTLNSYKNTSQVYQCKCVLYIIAKRQSENGVAPSLLIATLLFNSIDRNDSLIL